MNFHCSLHVMDVLSTVPNGYDEMVLRSIATDTGEDGAADGGGYNETEGGGGEFNAGGVAW